MLTTKVSYQKGGERKKRTSKAKKVIEQKVSLTNFNAQFFIH